jgi:SAM-dependent methyltransferase
MLHFEQTAITERSGTWSWLGTEAEDEMTRTTFNTANDFNNFYSKPDPWGIAHAAYRDKALHHRCIAPFTDGKSVLELGCGEAHLTGTVFAAAKRVHGIDISEVAIARARASGLPNATFETADLLSVSLRGYDVVTAVECLYYLAPAEQDLFLAKVAAEHDGKLLIVTGPIVGKIGDSNYFTHDALVDSFAKHGITVLQFYNLNLRRRGFVSATADRVTARLPLGGALLDRLPERWINQRCYIALVAGP